MNLSCHDKHHKTIPRQKNSPSLNHDKYLSTDNYSKCRCKKWLLYFTKYRQKLKAIHTPSKINMVIISTRTSKITPGLRAIIKLKAPF